MINKIYYSIILGALLFSVNPLTALSAEENDFNFREEIINKINDERARAGIKPLETDEKLEKAAGMKAEDMAKNSYFAHYSPSGVTPWQWFYEAGYKPLIAGENLALSRSNKSDIVKSWMNSDLHQKNILNERFTGMGIGISKGQYAGRDAYFIVQTLGKPVLIKNESK